MDGICFNFRITISQSSKMVVQYDMMKQTYLNAVLSLTVSLLSLHYRTVSVITLLNLC